MDTSLQGAGKQSKMSNICPLCDEPIIESGEHTKGQDAVYCEGQCKTWLHRKCAALPKSVFAQIGESDEPFVCCYCLLVTQKVEIQSLKSLVESLNTKLLQLSNQLNSVDTPKTNDQTDTTESLVQTESRTAVLQHNVSKNYINSSDRKYNIVVYGIEECPAGTPRSERSKHDVNESLSIFSNLDNDIQPFAIKDSLRLGKYKKESKRPRPVLVKMNRLIDVSSVLSKRRGLPAGITIKPDMTSEQQRVEASLLKERWSLTQRGVDKKDIKLKAPILYVQGKKYAEFTNSSLVKYFTIDSSTLTVDNTTLNDSSTSTQAATPLLSPTKQPKPKSS